ncbi:uncharacterized protein LOC132720567 [Ruditapes philippinarum]|uniref:uncharacterized protein LOC132720567 n=1 Tax=Ruditapes philippinarum TaxID=129788 RepID=UPI00295A6726|nr:uncharacterized protein LOC132720567 [Ruditapes philippinarum]
MYQVPNYTQAVSMKLSEVLADIGVDDRIVLKRRRSVLLREAVKNVNDQLWNMNIYTSYYFGSRSEGTTTMGLRSDADHLFCLNAFSVIQDWSEWIPGVLNYLMIQDSSVSPGYCVLQMLRPDVPLPADGESDQYFFRDRTGKILLKHIILPGIFHLKHLFGGFLDRLQVHGPAGVNQGPPGYCDMDLVLALHCKTWPQQARRWQDQHSDAQWPSAEIKQYCSRTGCFVVPVGYRGSEHEQLEWRISTSLAERCLMFNLNITQIRCYVLMKMIIKSFLDPQFEHVISSYMCKTVLLHCIANSHFNIWRENNLLSCLSLCLYLLYNNIINENCPHFIIPENNLMRGKISPAVKPYILEIVNNIINSKGAAMLGIKYDDIGSRLQFKFFNLCRFQTSKYISGLLLYDTATNISISVPVKNKSPHEAVQILTNCISKILNVQCEGMVATACQLKLPWCCTTLGSVLASININQHNTVLSDALKLISLGLNTDVASSKLKLASILYCIQDIQKVDLVLSEIVRRYDLNYVEPFCACYEFERKSLRRGYFAICDIYNEDAQYYATASCVKFLPCEFYCVPTELRYEMVRSTQEERIYRTEIIDDWMDCAVVDSLPYLYFLQYKVNSHLGRNNEKQSALSKLLRTIIIEPDLGHRETALNILGKCMEQEGRVRDALQCYLMSLNLRRRNNAAKIHICALLSVMGNFRA